MAIRMIELPYSTNALAPYISKKTLEFHYGKHYKKYVSTLNKLTLGTPFESSTLEEIILKNFKADNAIYHNAAQAWNHAFLWNSMSPHKIKPSLVVRNSLDKQFGSIEEFKALFSKASVSLFGSGWIWLVKKLDGTLAIEALGNAGNPLTKGEVPILVCDVWEHAYYLDYQNEREKYVKQFFNVLNWNFLAKNLSVESRPEKTKAVPVSKKEGRVQDIVQSQL